MKRLPGLLLAGAVVALASCAPAAPAAVPAPVTTLPPVSATPGSAQPASTLPPAAPAATLSQLDLPTPGPNPISAWRPPPYPVPRAVRPDDHFYFLRPIPSGNVNWPHPRYRYGNTLGGVESIHSGVDLGAARGTPVLAAGAGKVVWVGYGLYGGVENPKDPYGLAILLRHEFGYEGRLLYTVYSHLSEARVWEGQRVEAGEEIGKVGNTGHADGAHLHFEVRFGEDGYFTTRNPELWMVPPEGWGVLAGRIGDTLGMPMPEQLVRIYSLETGQRWDVWTYALETVRPDDHYGENFVISDLPSGPYEVQVDFAGHTSFAQMLVLPGQTTLFEFRGRRGFVVEPTPTPQSFEIPPAS